MAHKTALVTGANRGIGQAIAIQLAGSGIDVLAGMRNVDDAPSDFSDLNITPVHLDVTDPNHLDRLNKQYGSSIDILINNAGVLFQNGMLEAPDQFDTCMNVMVRAPFELIRICTPTMVERHYGRIFNVSSDWGAFSQGLNGPGAYGVAKAALNALTLRMSRELPAYVKINAMCPGWVKTRMGGEAADLSPAEAADTAVWLATLDKGGPTGEFFRDRKPMEW